MSECEQDLYRILFMQYFGVSGMGEEKKYFDTLLTNLYSDLIDSGKIDEVNSTFAQYRDENNVKELFRYFWGLEEAHKILSLDMSPSTKSKKLSTMFMKDGTRFLQNKLYAQALDLLNMSVMTAPHPKLSEEVVEEGVNSSNLPSGAMFLNVNNDYDTDDELLSDNEAYNEGFKSLSIRYSLTDCEEVVDYIEHCDDYNVLSLSYASRASVLFELKQYEKCISDIDRAMDLGYPKPLQYRVYAMKHSCLTLLQKQQEDNLEQSIASIDDLNLSELTTEESISTMKSLLDQCYQNENPWNASIPTQDDEMYKMVKKMLTDDELIFAYKNPAPPDLKDPNPHIPSLSSAVGLKFSPDKGRHMASTRDIKPGEVLLVEKAYMCTVDVLDPTSIRSFCCTCLARCSAPLPCQQCCKVVFCSDECRRTGWTNFHKLECENMHAMIKLGSSLLPKVYKIIASLPFTKLKNLIPHLEKEASEKPRYMHGFDKDSVYSSTAYETVHHLEGNFNLRSVSQLIHLCSLAFIIVKMLVNSKLYFVNELGKPIKPSEEEFVLVGSTAFNHMAKVLCNSAEVGEYQININNLKNDHEMVKAGSGIFPAICLFNHSCNPSAMVFSYGCYAVCHAVSFIPAGDDITFSYKMLYYINDVAQRKEDMLKHYFFVCKCEACEGDWKLETSMHKLSPDKLSRRNFNGHLTCLEREMNDIVSKFHAAVMDIKENEHRARDHLKLMIDTVEFFDKYVELPSHIHFLAQHYLVFFHFGYEMSACRYIRGET